jgi:hypothetical protein
VGGDASSDKTCVTGCNNSCDWTAAADSSAGYPLAFCWHLVGSSATKCSCIPAGSNSLLPAGQPSEEIQEVKLVVSIVEEVLELGAEALE